MGAGVRADPRDAPRGRPPRPSAVTQGTVADHHRCRRHRLVRLHHRLPDGSAAGQRVGHGRRAGRQRLPEGQRRAVPGLLRADLGTPPEAHPAGAGQPRVRDPQRVRLLRVLRRSRRHAGPGLVRLRPRGVAHLRAELELRRDRRLLGRIAAAALAGGRPGRASARTASSPTGTTPTSAPASTATTSRCAACGRRCRPPAPKSC